MRRTQTFNVGDKVAYKAAFLRSICEFSGPMPHARGTITGLVPLGKGPDATILADITWDRPGIPPRVNVGNLTLVSRIAADAALA